MASSSVEPPASSAPPLAFGSALLCVAAIVAWNLRSWYLDDVGDWVAWAAEAWFRYSP